MSEFDSLMQGMSLVLSAHHLGLMVIGVLLGIWSACCRASVRRTG